MVDQIWTIFVPFFRSLKLSCGHFERRWTIYCTQLWHTVKRLADGNIGGLLSKPPIRQNKFPAKISGHTVLVAWLSYTSKVKSGYYIVYWPFCNWCRSTGLLDLANPLSLGWYLFLSVSKLSSFSESRICNLKQQVRRLSRVCTVKKMSFPHGN